MKSGLAPKCHHLIIRIVYYESARVLSRERTCVFFARILKYPKGRLKEMACFLVSAAEAAVVTIAVKVIEKKEKAPDEVEIQFEDGITEIATGIPFSKKMKWLRNMLWGGAALLAFEHVWHGEIVPRFPFLTAAGDSADAAEMLHEMATVGVTMAVLVTAVWFGMLGVSALIEKREQKTALNTIQKKDERRVPL